jgi:hypothetical protein
VVVGTGPNGEQEVGQPRPREDAMRIFAGVLAARPGAFGPHEKCRVKVVAL